MLSSCFANPKKTVGSSALSRFIIRRPFASSHSQLLTSRGLVSLRKLGSVGNHPAAFFEPGCIARVDPKDPRVAGKPRPGSRRSTAHDGDQTLYPTPPGPTRACRLWFRDAVACSCLFADIRDDVFSANKRVIFWKGAVDDGFWLGFRLR